MPRFKMALSKLVTVVHQLDFKKDWKNFQQDLRIVKEHASGVQNIYILF